MKRLLIALVCVGATFASAQTKSFKDTERLYCNTPLRNHFVLPQLDGYNCYTADLHIHTIYSEGEVSPNERGVVTDLNHPSQLAI